MKQGFTIIEVMTAVLVTVIGVVGIYALVPRVLTISSANQSKFIASQLAREGLEIVRNIRDSNVLDPLKDWDDGFLACASDCEGDYDDPNLSNWMGDGRYLRIDDTPGKEGFYNYENGPDTRFKRRITITKPEAYKIDVQVEVDWGGKYSPFVVKEYLYNWR